MNILVTGARGFVGRNLIENLKNIRDKKGGTRDIFIEEIYEYDLESSEDELEFYCKNASFVFNLAGVNRTDNIEEFKAGNLVFIATLLSTLQKYQNTAPVMLASSIQATLIGTYNGEYGRSKKAGEELFFSYAKATGVRVLVYRFPNLFGKWCRPNYNSVIATFCNNLANDLPIQINNRVTPLEFLYIDDLVEEMLDALVSKEHRCEFVGLEVHPCIEGHYCYVPVTYKATLGEIVDLLNSFKNLSTTLLMPSIPNNSFVKKLYSTFLSYLPEQKTIFNLKTNVDDRGTFTELLKTKSNGQFSVNISKPGVTKGQHWHNSKWEIFIVVAGHGLIEERKIGTNEIRRYEVSGELMQAIYMLPGYTHNIINLSETENLVTFMWANELFNPDYPDTFREMV